MPTYEYRCPACGRDFERFQRMSDPPGAPCPASGKAAERLISAGGGLLFKGQGFYITDYRSDGYKERAKQDSGEGKGSADGTDKDGRDKKERGKDGRGKDGQAKAAERKDRSAKDGAEAKDRAGKRSGDAGKASKGSGKGSKSSGGGKGGG